MRPVYRSRAFLVGHIRDTLDFYERRCVDPSGGFYHYFRDDGTVHDRHTRHLLSSARFVVNFAIAYRQFRHAGDLHRVRHGVDFLRDVHRDPATGGYAWQLDWREGRKKVLDATNHCYGLACVLLAYAHALHAGLREARHHVAETFALMEQRFWEPAHALYADEASADWSALSAYRGQNANMRACEALIAAFQATGQTHYIQRAATLAQNITRRQAALADGLVWEHYRADWSLDAGCNRHGFEPGHLAAWARLLLVLERHPVALGGETGWLLPRAEALFEAAVRHGWDEQNGGLAHGLALDGSICDGHKHGSVQAEALAAAALLGARTGQQHYWDWYRRLWDYSWEHMVDHEQGAWFHILAPDNRKLGDEKSAAGKTDYHTLGACYEVLNVVGD